MVFRLDAEAGRQEQLIPLFPEHEDSGIDSDDADRSRRQDDTPHMSDGSSPDDDVVIKAPWSKDEPKDMNMLMPEVGDSPGRSSPPLYEVELTASDEDDDGSVLELVIPVQLNSRYQRVPTSSPNKTEPKLSGILIAFFCCLRK